MRKAQHGAIAVVAVLLLAVGVGMAAADSVRPRTLFAAWFEGLADVIVQAAVAGALLVVALAALVWLNRRITCRRYPGLVCC